MIAPALAIEPPTPQDNDFQFVDVSNSNLGISRLQARLESPLKASFDFRDPSGTFICSPSEILPSSPKYFSAGFFGSALSSHNICDEQKPVFHNKEYSVPIARSNLKGHAITPSYIRKGCRHYRDLSGTSSTSSTSSLYDISPAIDTTALQPPLSKLQNELIDFSKNEKSYIVSPFVNQVIEHGPDGAMTGRYSRPLTSTGRPSHARKTPPGHVKRPRNAFILFRSHACSSNLIPPSVEKDHRQISRIVSHMWKSLLPEEKMKWEREAEAEKELHRKLHPDYRYKPIYRKENSDKKPHTSLSSSVKKKKNLKKKSQGANANEENTAGLSKELRNCSSEILRERHEEIRCEAVARVLMETQLSGIKLDDSQMEERVLEQVRLAKSKDAIQSQMSSQLENYFKRDETETTFYNTHPTSLSILGGDKSKDLMLASLQARRKSLLARSNSAPPPPSPVRMMHVREVVYNPKARGSRELSPDFPKPRLVAPEQDLELGSVSRQPENFLPGILCPSSFPPQLSSESNFNPFVDLYTRNSAYYHYRCNPTPPQQLEQLFHSPDLSFSDESCFSSQQNDNSYGFFAQLNDQGHHSTFNGLLNETKPLNPENLSIRSQLENYSFPNVDFPSALDGQLLKLKEDAKSEPSPSPSHPQEETQHLGIYATCDEASWSDTNCLNNCASPASQEDAQAK